MPDLGNTTVFSQTDASNNSGTAPSWSGSAAPSTLDDAGRGLQGAVFREWNWRNYTLTAAGTADAKTLTYSVAPAAYYNGQRFAFIANTTNTTTCTLNVNSLGAKTIKRVVSGTLTALAAGEMVSGMYVEVARNASDDSFVWVNYIPPTSAATTSASGLVELATTTETLTGTDTVRAVTPDSLAALWEDGGSVASAGTISLGEGGYFNITGTTTITDIDLGTDKAGRTVWLKFAGALTLTHSGTTLILPGGANITTAAGDVACFVSEGSDAVRCVSYNKANGTAVVTTVSGGATLLGTINTTSGSEQGLTSLTLTNYKFLRFVLVGVSATSGTTMRISEAAGSNQVSIGLINSGTSTMRGIIDIDLTDGTFASNIGDAGTTASTTTATAAAGDTNITTAATAVYVSLASNAFDAGSVRVYGIA